MFIIKKTQLEAFRDPIRKKKRESTLLELQSQGLDNVYETDKEIIIEDKGNKSVLHYSEKNLLADITKPSGVHYDIEYDGEDRLNKFQFKGDEAITLAFKKDLPSQIALNDATIDLRYNTKNQISHVIYPDNKHVSFEYDESSQLRAIINRAGEVETFRTIVENDKILHGRKDALGRESYIVQNQVGGIEKVVLQDNSSIDFDYDEEEDAQTIKLRNGTNKITYFGELYPNRVEWEDENFQNIILNDALQIASIENPTGTINYEYDEKQRVVTESFQSSSVKYEYEGAYLKKTIYPTGLDVEYQYDADERLVSLIVDGKECKYQYAPNDTVQSIQYPNGLTEYQASKILGGLQSSKIVKSSGEKVSQQQFGYDILSRLVSYQDEDKNSVKNWSFEYDAESRLTQAKELGSRAIESFVYDKKGNLSQANDAEITVGKMDEVRSIAVQTISYDQGGNINAFINEKGKKVNLQFALNDTLKTAKIDNDSWEYWYDGLGRRVGKANNKEAFKYVWAGDKLLVETHKTQEKITTREYIYTDTIVPVAFRENNQLYWLQKDVRGAITRAFDAKGETVWAAHYTVFGKAEITIEKVRQPWRLYGQYEDTETGLHYNFARYYSPHLRFFLSLDPKWFQYGATNYSYVANDPFNKIDGDGNMPDWMPSASTIASVGVGIVAGIAAGAAVVALAPVVAAGSLAAVAIAGTALLVGGAVSGIATYVTQNLLDGKPICLPCLIEEAAIGAALGLIGGVIGKVLGKILAPVASKILPKIAKLFSKAGGVLKGALGKAVAGLKQAMKKGASKVKSLVRGVEGNAKNVSPPKWKGPADYSHIKDSRFKVEEGKEFSQAQKKAMLDANREHNDGFLRSDKDGTILEAPQQSKKGVTPPQNEAQVDHVKPKSLGGLNSTQTNAQVLSREQNIAKSNKPPP
jgi:RHS repeat-associated protein